MAMEKGIYKMSQDSNDTLPNNLLMFQAAIAKSFQDISKCVSEKEFLKMLTMLESKKSIVKKLHKVMEDSLSNDLESDLKMLITEESVVEGMKKINKLVDETTVPADIKVWRPPGDVNLHLRSQDVEHIKKEYEDLKVYISKTVKENEELMQQITKRRKTIKSIHAKMNQLLNVPFQLSELENTYKFNQEFIEKLNDVS